MSQTRPESPAMGGSYIRQSDGTLVANDALEMRGPASKPKAKPAPKPAPTPTAKPTAKTAVKED